MYADVFCPDNHAMDGIVHISVQNRKYYAPGQIEVNACSRSVIAYFPGTPTPMCIVGRISVLQNKK